MKAIALATVLLFAPLASAAPYPATTRPASLQDLESKVSELAKRVEELARELSELRASLAKPAARAQAAKADAIATGLKARKLVEGMTVEQVEQVTGGGIGGKGQLISRSQGNAVYRWAIRNSLNVVDDRDLGKVDSYTITCRFIDGQLASFTVDNRGGPAPEVVQPGTTPRRK